MIPSANSPSMGYHPKEPQEPKILTEEAIQRYMALCRDTVKESLINIDEYKKVISELFETISLQNEMLIQQNKDIEDAANIVKKIQGDKNKRTSLSDVTSKVWQAVAVIFFFLRDLLCCAAETLYLLTYKGHLDQWKEHRFVITQGD